MQTVWPCLHVCGRERLAFSLKTKLNSHGARRTRALPRTAGRAGRGLERHVPLSPAACSELSTAREALERDRSPLLSYLPRSFRFALKAWTTQARLVRLWWCALFSRLLSSSLRPARLVVLSAPSCSTTVYRGRHPNKSNTKVEQTRTRFLRNFLRTLCALALRGETFGRSSQTA